MAFMDRVMTGVLGVIAAAGLVKTGQVHQELNAAGENVKDIVVDVRQNPANYPGYMQERVVDLSKDKGVSEALKSFGGMLKIMEPDTQTGPLSKKDATIYNKFDIQRDDAYKAVDGARNEQAGAGIVTALAGAGAVMGAVSFKKDGKGRG